MSRNDNLLGDRLNAEPAIFRGCTFSELGVMAVVSILLWLPVSFTLAGLFGAITMGMGLAALGVIGTVYGTATLFQRIKRGRPDGYYQQRIVLFLHDTGLRRSGFVRRSGDWDIGRRLS